VILEGVQDGATCCAKFLFAMGALRPAQGDVLTAVGTGLNKGRFLSAAGADPFVREEAQRAARADHLTTVGAGALLWLELGAAFWTVGPRKVSLCQADG